MSLRCHAVCVLLALAALVGCDTPRYHPAGFDDPQRHGPAALLQLEDCRICHGARLGGDGFGEVGCDGCHKEGWRSDCTYCHGGRVDDTGAPPRDLGGEGDRASIPFPAHPVHVRGYGQEGAACELCHQVPEGAVDDGHIFDDSPGVAEVRFSALNPAGVYEGDGRCANLYCHGDGEAERATVDEDDGELGCGGCHADANSAPGRLRQMSGRHALHILAGLACAQCHARVVDERGAVVAPRRHPDGVADVDFGANAMTLSGELSCEGACHQERHSERPWTP